MSFLQCQTLGFDEFAAADEARRAAEGEAEAATTSTSTCTSPSPRGVSSTSTGTRSDRFAYSPVVASPSPVKKRSLFNVSDQAGGGQPFLVRNNASSEGYCCTPSCLWWSNGWKYNTTKFVYPRGYFQSKLVTTFAFCRQIFKHWKSYVVGSAMEVMQSIENATSAQLSKVLISIDRIECYNYIWISG
jgi:hypothetical protein